MNASALLFSHSFVTCIILPVVVNYPSSFILLFSQLSFHLKFHVILDAGRLNLQSPIFKGASANKRNSGVTILSLIPLKRSSIKHVLYQKHNFLRADRHLINIEFESTRMPGLIIPTMQNEKAALFSKV